MVATCFCWDLCAPNTHTLYHIWHECINHSHSKCLDRKAYWHLNQYKKAPHNFKQYLFIWNHISPTIWPLLRNKSERKLFYCSFIKSLSNFQHNSLKLSGNEGTGNNEILTDSVSLWNVRQKNLLQCSNSKNTSG